MKFYGESLSVILCYHVHIRCYRQNRAFCHSSDKKRRNCLSAPEPLHVNPVVDHLDHKIARINAFTCAPNPKNVSIFGISIFDRISQKFFAEKLTS